MDRSFALTIYENPAAYDALSSRQDVLPEDQKIQNSENIVFSY